MTDRVRIMTIHGAKGLEFPIVALADLGGPGQSRRGVRLLTRGLETDGRLSYELSLVSGLETKGFADRQAEEKLRDNDEEARLAYVGVTRARDYLICSLAHHDKGTTSVARRLVEVTGAGAPLGGSAQRTVTEPPTQGAVFVDPDFALASHRRAVATFHERRERLERPLVVSAGSLEGPPVKRQRGVRRSGALDEPRGPLRRKDATDLGRAVHAVLERAMDGRADVSSLVASETARHGVSQLSGSVERLVAAVLSEPIVAAARDAEQRWHELPLAVAIGDGLLEGVVDLAYLDANDELVLVDYKTDSIGEQDAPRLFERYRLQLGAYAYALEVLLARPVARAALVVPFESGRASTLELDDVPSAARDAAREVAVRLAGGRAPD